MTTAAQCSLFEPAPVSIPEALARPTHAALGWAVAFIGAGVARGVWGEDSVVADEAMTVAGVVHDAVEFARAALPGAVEAEVSALSRARPLLQRMVSDGLMPDTVVDPARALDACDGVLARVEESGYRLPSEVARAEMERATVRRSLIGQIAERERDIALLECAWARNDPRPESDWDRELAKLRADLSELES